MRFPRILLMLCVLTLLAVAQAAWAQVPGPLLPGGAFEVGVFYHDFDRSVDFQDHESTIDGPQWTALARMGVTESMSAAVKFATALGGADIGDYSYVLGAAVQTRMWSHGRSRATTSISYTRTLNIYRESAGGDLLVESLDWNVQFEQDLSLKDVPCTVWAGPTLSNMNAQPQAPAAENTSGSTRILGGIVGAQVLFVDHVSITAQAMWINAFEPSLFVGYRF
jgi:hypothetical protein